MLGKALRTRTTKETKQVRRSSVRPGSDQHRVWPSATLKPPCQVHPTTAFSPGAPGAFLLQSRGAPASISSSTPGPCLPLDPAGPRFRLGTAWVQEGGEPAPHSRPSSSTRSRRSGPRRRPSAEPCSRPGLWPPTTRRASAGTSRRPGVPRSTRALDCNVRGGGAPGGEGSQTSPYPAQT